MHLVRIDTVSLDEGEAAVDLGQEPGDIVVLSFTDSDLAGIAEAAAAEGESLPALRLARLARLRHPLSVDLYVESVVARARLVVIRCLGGLDYWRYGIERCAEAARANGVRLVVLPGDDRPDPRLSAYATAPELAPVLDAYFRAGGRENLRQMLRRLAAEIGHDLAYAEPRPLPRGFPCCPGCGPVPLEQALAAGAATGPAHALVLIYRSAALGGDLAPAAALTAALAARGIGTLVVAVSSLKDPEAAEAVRAAIAARRPDLIVAATAFAARDDAGFVLDAADCPVLQAYTVGSAREAWEASARGLGAADLAMQVALPEFDGRLAGFPISFKGEAPEVAGFAERRAVPYAPGIAALADRAAAWIRLAHLRRSERRVALVLSDYPARGGRAGFAVGLDTPESARAIAADLAAAGYALGDLPDGPNLMRALTAGEPGFTVSLAAYRDWLSRLPAEAQAALAERWGAPEDDPACRDGAFRFRSVPASPPPPSAGEGGPCVSRGRVRGATQPDRAEAFTSAQPSSEAGFPSPASLRSAPSPAEGGGRGGLTVFLQPDRGRAGDRKAGYHDPDEPPTHAYLAFHLGVQRGFDALVHLGTHGTTEWLPGKAVALSPACWPALAVGRLPVIYPFIVDDPGEAAPLKRRLGGIALGHLTPEIQRGGREPETMRLREQVEEYAAASLLDPRRAALIARAILDEAEALGHLSAAGIAPGTPMPEALAALDAHLCDLGETAFRDGLHVFGRAPEEAPPARRASAAAERASLIAALDGRFVAPGPSGSPSRGRADVLPTGRNLTTLDPRAIPTRAAATLGAKAAEAVVTRYLQDEGTYPERVVMDLWASPTLRTGGEDVAHALHLMGVRPLWDHASTRVTGFEVLPPALLGRPRIDVTVRISGAFRDTFPETLALIDRAARAVALREEPDEENPLAAARRRGEDPARVFGAAPGRYGAGAAETALDGTWERRQDLGAAYLDATGFAYGDAAGASRSFAERVARADAYLHAFDVAERDLLDGDAAAEALGGFHAAAESLGAHPALFSLDVSEPERPKARSAREDVARLVRARLSAPAWIAAQLAHGHRGAQELAQGIDAVFVLAATTDAVSHADLDRLYGAWIADAAVFERLRAANPDAARAILDRFEELRARGLWQTRRNAMPTDALMAEAAG
ncbi:cobaltochelatase subunit CobN [Methylobacterium symbioticum]|uniref:Aerobic cobaltochelatase subunit CobN n=1 Tax=Methylobacterium symbioticum TaxID=2584084 RepID=A0A509EIZ2_9HYPH|nr:cobaltochelatase subunit CobN [Methylobacterium symbioticum]VUD74042.1 Aerobic cobaltochelatase subunit CobN [Methylobacterium symbioticum]